jgi:hypothetical protein
MNKLQVELNENTVKNEIYDINDQLEPIQLNDILNSKIQDDPPVTNSYSLPENFNFKEELEKMLNEENELNDDLENNVCLITYEPLEEHSITLTCGHSFNYMPLFESIKNAKLNSVFPSLYNKYTSICCPYCRNVHFKLLPYVPSLVSEKIRGVNYIVTERNAINHRVGDALGYKCENIIGLNANFNPNLEANNETNCKYLYCPLIDPTKRTICLKDFETNEKIDRVMCIKCYRLRMKEQTIFEKEQAALKKKLANKQLKEAEKAKKLLERQKLKEQKNAEKMKQKELLKANTPKKKTTSKKKKVETNDADTQNII